MSAEAGSSDTSVFSSNMQSAESTRQTTPVNGNSVSQRHLSKSTMALIEESMKYDMRSEYFIPTTFLRERRKPARADSDEEERVVKKASKGKRAEKQSAVKTSKGAKTSVRNGSETTAMKKKEAAVVRNSRKTKEDRTSNGNRKYKRTSSSIDKTVKAEGEIAQLAKDAESEDRPECKATVKNGLFLDDVDENTIARTDFFNFCLIRNPSQFCNETTSSVVLTENTDQVSFTPLKSVLFPESEELFLLTSEPQKYDYNPLFEVGQTIEAAVHVYFPTSFKKKGIALVRSLSTAYLDSDDEKFTNLVQDFNSMVSSMSTELVSEHLEKNTISIPTSFVHALLHACYTRAIYPNSRKLKKYTGFSNFVYGELMPGFLTMVYKKCGLSENNIFMDLGSGVGNCVIQAALEFGCQLSFGCEIMDSASEMAEIQLKELESRCNLWGINLPNVEYSLRKSFVDNERVNELIPQCDVILINNFIFDAPLNKKVETIVQNLKPGAKIISLKSIRPPGYSINYDDMDNIFNRLHVESFKLPENSVSWTYRSVGDYFISTVLDTIDESIFCPPILGRIRKKESVHYTR